MQGLGEGSDITLAVDHRAISVDLDQLRQPATDGVSFVYDDYPRVPELVERIVHNATTGVSQTRIFASQDDGNVRCEALLGTVDAINVDDPNFDRDLSWPGVSVGALDQYRRFRAAARWIEAAKRPANNRNLLRRPSGLRLFVSAIFTNVVSSTFLYLLGRFALFQREAVGNADRSEVDRTSDRVEAAQESAARWPWQRRPGLSSE